VDDLHNLLLNVIAKMVTRTPIINYPFDLQWTTADATRLGNSLPTPRVAEFLAVVSPIYIILQVTNEATERLN